MTDILAENLDRRIQLSADIDQYKWWHVIELAPGITTPGKAGNRTLLPFLEIPADLTGKTILDIGCWDGYFSFECENRGAARVVASDVWEYAGRGAFDFARGTLGSAVEPLVASVYDLSPDLFDGDRFDVVLFLGVLYHLKDPLGALEKVASVTAPGGTAIIDTVVDVKHLTDKTPVMTYFPGAEENKDASNWWAPNPAAVAAMCGTAGFAKITNRIQLYGGNRGIFHAVKGSDRHCKSIANTQWKARHSWR